MTLIFRAGWFLSMIAVLASLLFVYASLQEEVIVQQDGASYVSLSRETFFYVFLALITLINAFVYIIAKMFKSDESFRSWFHGLIFTLNVFIIVTLFFLSAVNSAEKFKYAQIGFLIYGSIGLVLLWSLAWPSYSFYRKIFPKPSV